jgi:hypothetical protein
MTKTTTKYGIVGITALVAILAMSTVAIALSQSAIAAPANKTVMGSGDIGALASSDGWYSIISGTIKTSDPSDLIVNHNQECVIHTGLNLDSTVWELCSFLEGEEGFDRDDICSADEIYFDSFIRTKQAHSWSWVVLDVGKGMHDIEVQAKLFDELDAVDGKTTGKKGPATDSGDSTVDTILEIGKRNLIVSEEKLATGSTLG